MSKHDMRNLESLKTLFPNEKKAILEFASLLKQRFGTMIKEIILFGSKVKGDAEKDSDIDILIVLTTLSWKIKENISELASRENIKYDVLISTIRYDVSTWENPLIKSSPFALAVRDEGIRL